MQSGEVKVVSERLLCRGRRFSFASLEVEYRGKRIRRDVLLHPGAVVILPLLDDGSVVLLRQWRAGCRCWLLELPAGTLEEGEKPEDAAKRELLEETGYEPGELVKLGMFYSTPGTSTEVMHIYLARRLVYRGARPEADEVLETLKLPFDRLYEMVLQGEIVDAKTALAVLIAKARGLV